jgi:DNA mismatch endonuclease (patch repair protein)
MTDKLTTEKRSWNMSRIRSIHTKPEILLRSLLHRMGFRFRLYSKHLPGHPDIVLQKHKTAIFVHGCFWHQHPGCNEAVLPKTNQEYWKSKLERNVIRDKKRQQELRAAGWQVLQFWECQLEKDPIRIAMLVSFILRRKEAEKRSYTFPSRKKLLKMAEAHANYRKK